MKTSKKIVMKIVIKENIFLKQMLYRVKELYRVIYFNQKAWLKLYIDMNTKLGTKAKK